MVFSEYRRSAVEPDMLSFPTARTAVGAAKLISVNCLSSPFRRDWLESVHAGKFLVPIAYYHLFILCRAGQVFYSSLSAMEPTAEIRRLLDLMPASGRMMTKIVGKPEQAKVINSSFPLPWNQERPIFINFDLWRRLSLPQRDLLLLSSVSWLTGVKWLKPDVYQGVVVAGLLGAVVELVQSDAVGVVVAGGLSAIALTRIWRTNRSSQSYLDADQAAIQVAKRRGYNETEAAEHLLAAIEAVARLEGHSGLSFTELIRCQNLRALAGQSPVGVPQSIKRE